MSFSKQVKVICFYTENTPYEQEVIALRASCKTWNIPLELTALPSQGCWEKNVAIKPFFIREKLQKLKTPLFWVDADAIFLKKPNFSFLEGSDLSVRFMTLFQEDKRYALNTASLFINATKEGEELVDQWCAHCEELCKQNPFPSFVDQITLHDVLSSNKTAKIHSMPISYCKIFDIDSFFLDDKDVVIEQRQASRRFKDFL